MDINDEKSNDANIKSIDLECILPGAVKYTKSLVDADISRSFSQTRNGNRINYRKI